MIFYSPKNYSYEQTLEKDVFSSLKNRTKMDTHYITIRFGLFFYFEILFLTSYFSKVRFSWNSRNLSFGRQ